ncbi:hypothetical protein L1887_57046 [Cichorium endivia]|nr:hypothetical protein L1887_57046 [Cichorium endivia]
MAVEAPVSASQLAPADGALRDSPKGSAKRPRVSPNGMSTPLHDNSGNATPTRSSPNPTALESAKKDRKLDRERSDSKDSARARDKDRESRLPACEACRTRKVKCDALLPACTPCQKSGRECFGRDKVPNVSRGLVYELQQKVKDLESRLALASSGATTNGSASKRGGPPAADDDDMASDAAETSVASSSRLQPPGPHQHKRGRHGYGRLHIADPSLDSGDESSSTESTSSSDDSPKPSPNDFVQQTSTILETLSSDLTGSTHLPRPASTTRPTTQTLDDDEASALAALSKHHKDRRTRSPHRLKRRSSSNASRHREDASSYLSGSLRLREASTSLPFKSRSRMGRFGTISAYERTFFDRLIARYLTYMNTALPLINDVRLHQIATSIYQDDERSRLSAMAATPYDTMPPPPIPPMSASDRVMLSKHRYVVLMALSIALASLSRSHNFSPELRRLGHQYWAEAQALFPVLFRFGDIDKLRATLLQLQYALLVPSAGSVWELSGAAIRLVTELNLHVDRDYDSATNAAFSQETIDLRRRLFWTTYCLDRSLAVALARPPGLSDAWIHVQLPSLCSDADLLQLDRESKTPGQEQLRVDWQKQIFRSHINLRRVQSEILCRLHSVNPRDYSLDNDGVSLTQPAPARPSLALVMEVGPPTPNVEWQTRMMEKLAEWRSEYELIRMPAPATERTAQGDGVASKATPFITRDWIDLNHNLTISLLFRPSPNNPRPDSNGLQQAFMASGRAMKIYKSMHRGSTINFPWLATHHLFISGLTHLNALEKLTRTGIACPSPVVEVVFNVQSCASTLEALTSRNDGYGVKVRDTFDAAASAVLRSVLDPVTRQTAATGAMEGAVQDLEGFMRSSVDSLQGGQARQANRAFLESGGLRRASHHEIMQAAAQQHPTWLSDSTWSSINTIDAAPPPGSTIFVAAPPRTGRFGTPGHSMVPTLSERTTQSMHAPAGPSVGATVGQMQAAGASPRGFGVHAYAAGIAPSAAGFAKNANSDGDLLQNGSAAAGVPFETGARDKEPEAEVGQEERTASTFGFHNWLLQPYEGGADGLQFGYIHNNAFGAPTSGGVFGASNSPSMYAGADPFQYADAGQPAFAAQPKPAAQAETDASTLLDFLSMLPAASPRGAGANGSPAGAASKQ